MDVTLDKENGLSLAINFILGALFGGGGAAVLGHPNTTLP